MAEKEFIEREALLKDISESVVFSVKEGQPSLEIRGANKITDRIKAAPAADVVEVVHARFEWGFQNGQYGIWCTNCGAGWVNSENAEWIAQEHNYCPKCGAKMDRKGADNAEQN